MKQAKPVRPRTLGPPSQAGPAQDPWPPKPSRSGPGPLAPQAKPAWPRTLGPPSRQYNRQFNRQYTRQYNKQKKQNGSYVFPNELARFRNEAKPILGKIQKHCKNAVII